MENPVTISNEEPNPTNEGEEFEMRVVCNFGINPPTIQKGEALVPVQHQSVG